jgi:hypothetical protein
MVTFTRSLAVQLAPKGIRVNGIAPGTVMSALQAASRTAEDMEELGVDKVPLHNRAGQPAEMGPGFVFLASSDANAVTGQVLHLNSERIMATLHSRDNLTDAGRRRADGVIVNSHHVNVIHVVKRVKQEVKRTTLTRCSKMKDIFHVSLIIPPPMRWFGPL